MTSAERSEQMRLVKAKDTKPEMAVRRLVHRLGFRYRLHSKDLCGKPDLVFSSRKKVIFVHGCFWHGHDHPACKLARIPKTNRDYWISKIERNRIRDKETCNQLGNLGWTVLTIWECAVKGGKEVTIANDIQDWLDNGTQDTQLPPPPH